MRKHGPIKLTISERELLEELRVGWGLRTTREALREAIKFAHAETEPEEVVPVDFKALWEEMEAAKRSVAYAAGVRDAAIEASAAVAAHDILAGLGMLKRG